MTDAVREYAFDEVFTRARTVHLPLTPETKFCRDCKYRTEGLLGEDRPKCYAIELTQPQEVLVDVITGTVLRSTAGVADCAEMRGEYGTCGADAKLFERK